MFGKKKESFKYKIGLALGGGGTKGFAHVGALKALNENGIFPDFIAGTSAGSIVGALYSAGLTPDDIAQIGHRISEKEIKTSKLPFIPSSTAGLENILIREMGDISFSDLKLPFCAVAVDLKSAKEIDIMSGSVVKAVAGSCCVPLFFETVIFQDFHLMDGGLMNNIPADIAREMGCEKVIAIDVNPNRAQGTDSLKLMDVLGASLRIGIKANSQRGEEFSDIMITADTSRFKSTKLDGWQEIIKEGYDSTMAKMDEIKLVLGIKKLKVKKESFWARQLRLKKEKKEMKLKEKKANKINENDVEVIEG